jgi:hypothetical protein
MIVSIKGEPKYSLDTATGQLVNRISGNAVPADEPVIVFRAQDANLPYVLNRYIMLCKDPQHRLAASLRLAEVLEWQAANPLRVKEPDTVLDGEWPHLRHRSDDDEPPPIG